jgi:hypothetical protein
MNIKKYIIKNKKFFNTIKINFNYSNDFKIIDRIIAQTNILCEKLNPVLARDVSRNRNINIIFSNIFAGLISEYIWKYFLTKIAVKKEKHIQVVSGGSVEDFNQIDIILKNQQNKELHLEVRSSFPYLGIDQAIIKNFDIIGWYTNKIKTKEIKKDFYLRALFPYKIDNFKNKIKDQFEVCIAGGASLELLTNSPFAKYKEFNPREEFFLKNKKELTKYRVIEPIINGYDTYELAEHIFMNL